MSADNSPSPAAPRRSLVPAMLVVLLLQASLFAGLQLSPLLAERGLRRPPAPESRADQLARWRRGRYDPALDLRRGAPLPPLALVSASGHSVPPDHLSRGRVCLVFVDEVG